MTMRSWHYRDGRSLTFPLALSSHEKLRRYHGRSTGISIIAPSDDKRLLRLLSGRIRLEDVELHLTFRLSELIGNPWALAECKLTESAEAEHECSPSMHAHAVDFYDHAPSGFAFGHGNIAHDDARL